LGAQVEPKDWIPKPLRPLMRSGARVLERVARSLVDEVVAATPAIQQRYAGHRQATLVQNFPRLEELHRSEIRPFHERPNVVAYVGGVSRIRGALEMVDA